MKFSTIILIVICLGLLIFGSIQIGRQIGKKELPTPITVIVKGSDWIDSTFVIVGVPGYVTPADSNITINYQKAEFDTLKTGDHFRSDTRVTFYPVSKTWDFIQKVSVEVDTEYVEKTITLPGTEKVITKPDWWLTAAGFLLGAGAVLYLEK